MAPQSRMLAVEHPEYIIIGFLQYNLHWTTLKSPLRQKKRWLKTWFKSQKSNAIFRWVFVIDQWSFTPQSLRFEIKIWIFKSDLSSGTGDPGRLATLEKSRNLQTRDFLIINELGLFTKNLLDL